MSDQIAVPNNDIIYKVAEETHVSPEVLMAIANKQMTDGKLPKMEINEQNTALAAAMNMQGGMDSKENQQALYFYSIAQKVKENYGVQMASGLLETMGVPLTGNLPTGQQGHIRPKFDAIAQKSTSTEYRPSDAVVALNEKFEGFRGTAYTLFGVGHIGYGHSVRMGDGVVGQGPMTQKQAEAQLIADLKTFGADLVRRWPSHAPKKDGFLDLPQGIQDACVTYAFGCGPSKFANSPMAKLFKEFLATGDATKLADGAAAFANGIHTANGVSVSQLVRKNAAIAGLATSSTTFIANAPNKANIGSAADLTNIKVDPKGGRAADAAAVNPAPTIAPAPVAHVAVVQAAQPIPGLTPPQPG